MKKTPDPMFVAIGRVGILSRKDRHDPVALAEAWRDLRALRIEKAIHEALDAEAPLTADQRDELSDLLLYGSKVR